MIETPTVLILGAGASAPYGYPIGSKLKSQIISSLKEMLDNDDGWVHELKFDNDLVAEFNARFAISPRSSIDAFLSYQKEEFIPIGKTAIVDIISKSESPEQLDPQDEPESDDSPDHWYKYFTAKLIDCPFEDIGNNVGIISYNYDRSFETYLHYALITSFSECDDPADCRSLVKDNIPIVHMYGRLDPLPWECRGVIRKYGEKCDSKVLKHLSKKINLIQEAEKKGTIDKANELIDNANRVYFLGMDLYNNRSNIELLDTSLFKKKKIIATGYGLSDGEIRHIDNFFSQIQSPNIRFKIKRKLKSLDTIRSFDPF